MFLKQNNPDQDISGSKRRQKDSYLVKENPVIL